METVESEYWLVPIDPTKRLSTASDLAVRMMLLEMQPARSVSFVGTPAFAIQIVGPVGEKVGPDIAPAILTYVAARVGTSIRLTTDEPSEPG